MAASAKSRRACGPSFDFLASARSCDALKSPRNDTGMDMTNLHRSPPMNQSKTDLGIVNESQLLRSGISHVTTDHKHPSVLGNCPLPTFPPLLRTRPPQKMPRHFHVWLAEGLYNKVS